MHAKDTLQQVLELREAGQRGEALQLCQRLARSAPRQGGILHVLGVLQFERGNPAQAIRHVRKAIKLNPRDAEFHNSLGIFHTRLGEHKRAAWLFSQALRRDPRLAEAHCNLGNLRLDQGADGEAADHFRQALDSNPGYADAACKLAMALGRGAPPDEVLMRFQVVLELDPLSHQVRSALLDLIGASSGDEVLARAHIWLTDLVLHWLTADGVASQDAAHAAWRLCLVRHPSVAALVRAAEVDEEALAGLFESGDLEALLADPLFLAALEHCLLPWRDSEALASGLRRIPLAALSEARPLPEAALTWVVPLALQAHNAGHVYAIRDDEWDKERNLRRQVERALEEGAVPSAMSLATLALYTPLDSLVHAEALAATDATRWPAPLRPLLERTLLQPLEERQLAIGIRSLGGVVDDVSRAVRAQYEEAPYPRWTSVNRVAPLSLAMHLRSCLPHAPIPDALDGPVDVLIAGCGTGWEVAEAAITYQGARVTGLDLSRASLAYGLSKAREMGIANASFVHGDIMNAAALGTAFDYVQCGGVLHHMAAWKVLVGSLEPHGVMKVALYSRAARGAVARARALIAERNIDPTPDNIRAFRRFVMGQPPESPLSGLTKFTDFYYLSGCRDLLFHEHEHQLDLGYIKRACEELELEFLGFHFRDPDIPRRYRRAFAHDAGMTDLDAWVLFESVHPETFESMYQFWCRRREA